MRLFSAPAATCSVVLGVAALWGCGNSNTISGPPIGSSSVASTGGSGAGGQTSNGYVPNTPDAGPNLCGNSKIDKGEACDDGNVSTGDGCSASCGAEVGWSCPTPGSACLRANTCGNGTVESTESCDDGNTVPGDCCDATCQLEPNCVCTTPSPALSPPHEVCRSTVICGDGVVAGNEACDDGNAASGDGCNATCSNVEPGYTCPPKGGACNLAVNDCGNAKIDPGEECDDGDATSGNGCSANCKIESGYVCPVVGQKCKLKAYCGDGSVNYALGETCDDGNADDGDGCSASCKVESGFTCTTAAPSVCTAETCGNKRIAAAETCDDGNAKAGDGCSATCQLESGFTCPVVGAFCRAVCGDGLTRGSEQCDDGATKSGDGCGATCQLEPGYVCPAGQSCRKTVCGNKVKEGSEQCDDTDLSNGEVDLPFDGCYHCIAEPNCSAGACISACGDGQRFANEPCDDGNTFDGDGCSATCTIETGYNCTDSNIQSNPPTTVQLPLVVRDFVGLGHQLGTQDYHLDFNQHWGPGSGGLLRLVKPQLDTNGRPAWRWTPFKATGATFLDDPLAGCSCNESAPFACASETWGTGNGGASKTFQFCRPPCSCTNGTACICDNPAHLFNNELMIPNSGRANLSNPENFAQWYTNVNGVNIPIPYTLTLTLNTTAGTYDNGTGADFDPISKAGWIALGLESPANCTMKNASYTTETHFWFEYTGGERFDFSGDDDTWVFVNRQLVVDLGALHGIESGYFTLDTSNGSATTDSKGTASTVSLGLVLHNVYELAMFQAERNECGSDFKVTLRNFAKPKSTCTAVCGDGVVSANEACDLGKSASGASLNTGAYGGCKSDCTLAPYCGDGKVDTAAGEKCDDGSNTTVYSSRVSGCAPGCVIAPSCGDSKLDVNYGETCDLGSANSSTAYGVNQCTDQCQTAPFCGDGYLNPQREQCDDGQNNGGPTCGVTCQIKCGNGELDPGEQCDLETANNNGAYGGCRSNCTRAPYCGDGVKDAASGEQCDDAKNDGSYGTCKPNCTLAGYCGDGIKNGPEACDFGAANSTSAYGRDQCTNLCTIAPYCGDGIVNGPEQCDGQSTCTDTCTVAGGVG